MLSVLKEEYLVIVVNEFINISLLLALNIHNLKFGQERTCPVWFCCSKFINSFGVTTTCKYVIGYFKIVGRCFSVWSDFNNNFLFPLVG